MADFEYISAEETSPESAPNPPLDLSYHFSRVTLARKDSQIKTFYKYFMIPGIGNLAGGLPNASFFPYDTLEAQTALPDRFKPTPNDPNDPSKGIKESLCSPVINDKKADYASSSSHITVPHASALTNPLQKIDLTTALQYGTAQGYPPLYSFIRQFTLENLHPNIPYKDEKGVGAEIILTDGSTDGLGKVLEALSNVWSEHRDWVEEREGILCEQFAYGNAIQAAEPRGLNIVPVKVDLEGMLPSGPGGLEDVLENWDMKRGKRPHLMYTVTIGQNPTSGTLSVQRRKEIYALCSKYDVMIIEDDPYWYLQFPSATGKETEARGLTPHPRVVHTFKKSTGYEFLDSLVPSSLNIDVDGRVIRLDTFSKTIAPGCRLGWITAQPAIIERILRITEVSTQQPSGFVQAMVAELIMGPQAIAKEEFSKRGRKDQNSFTGWSTDGWVRWLEGLRGQYERRMNRMCTIMEEGRFLLKQKKSVKARDAEWAVILKTEMFTFDWPRAGMFLWIRICFENHPLGQQLPGTFLSKALWVFLTRKPYLVLVAPGTIFSPTKEIVEEEGWKFFRLCFAAVSEADIEACSERFASCMKDFWGIKDKKTMEDIGKEVGGEQAEGEGELVNLGMGWAC